MRLFACLYSQLRESHRLSASDLRGGAKKPLGAEFDATLTAAGSQNGSTGTGLHASTEAVGLRPAAVVRLKSALGHFDLLKLMG